MKIDSELLASQIDALAAITEAEPPVVTRVLFSEADLEGRAFVREIAESLGLSWSCDAVGNQFALWEGSEKSLAPFATGSHIDAIPNAGRFDGVVGVLGALEAIRALQATGFRPRRGIELIVFAAEEPTRYGIGCLGSRMLAGSLPPEKAAYLTDQNGITLDALRKTAGFEGELATVRQNTTRWHAFVELHIEQGPDLERDGVQIGVVERIAGPSAYRIRLEGHGGHAGAVLMPGRKDALLAGAELALAFEKGALESASPDTVATTGVFQVKPGAINSIPCDVLMEVDLRDTDLAARELVIARANAASDAISQRREVKFAWETINADPPAHCDDSVVATCLELAAQEGLTAKRMISRAYHDSLFMAQLCPTSMIFIPCLKGYSHRPDEFSSPEQMAAGVLLLARVLERLSS